MANGKDATENQFPYIVRILLDGNMQCTGSLINKWTVLTAAHCVGESYGCGEDYSLSQLTLDIGGIVKDQPAEPRKKVQHIIQHKDYKGKSCKYGNLGSDIALLIMDTPSDQTLVTLSETPVGTGVDIFPVGWGRTESGEMASKLKYAELQTLACSEIKVTLENQMCATAEYIRSDTSSGRKFYSSTCPGDSGGPVVTLVDGKDPAKYKSYAQVALTSWVTFRGDIDDCDKKTEDSKMGFLPLEPFLPWIKGEASTYFKQKGIKVKKIYQASKAEYTFSPYYTPGPSPSKRCKAASSTSPSCSSTFFSLPQ